jgi:glycolate oxidase iron-sulfur subunit
MSTQSTWLQSALNTEIDKLLGCIHCGLCLPACPTYLELGNENDSPRGRIYLMRAVAEGRLAANSESFARHIDLCLGCRACETACPAGVQYGWLLEAAREELLAHQSGWRRQWQKQLLKFALKYVFPYPKRLNFVFGLLRWLRGSSLIQLALREGLIREISPQAEFVFSLLLASTPAYASEQSAPTPPSNADQASSRTASLFTGCVMEGIFGHTNAATARVLAANGCYLLPVETQVCCGALHAHAGDIKTARALARQNIKAFEQSIPAEMAEATMIIVNAAGCGAILKEYGQLLRDDPDYAERAQTFSARVRDVTEYLVQIGMRSGAPLPERVTYDAPCHLYHAQHITAAPQQLLAAIPGLDYVPLEGMTDCCGGAGIYNLSEPEMSERLLSDKIAKVKATGAQVLLTANPGCQMQLGAGARLFGANCRVMHVVELLDESYRRAGLYLSGG